MRSFTALLTRRLPLAVLFSLLLPLSALAQSKPKLAVMTMLDQTRTVGEELAESLTDALRTRLAQSGQYIVIDKSRQADVLKRLMREQKRESYKACYDNRCQVPLGQALAADSILRTKLTQVGSYYLLNAELLDLAKEAVIGAAQAQVYVRPRAGRDDRLLRGLGEIVHQLTAGATTEGGVTGREMGPATEPPEEGVAGGTVQPMPVPSETPEERRRREEARHQRRAELEAQQIEARRQAEFQAEQSERRRRRLTKQIYGWMAISTGAIFAGSGLYYVTAKVSQATDQADKATSPSALDSAADEASKSRTTGLVLLGIGGAVVGVGVILLLTAPSLIERPPPTIGKLNLERLPTVGLSGRGAGLSWGGSF